MLEKEPTTYRIAAHFCAAIINDDTTGLEAGEEKELDAFLQWVGVGVWDCEGEAQLVQDEVTGLWADCIEAKFYREVEVEVPEELI